MKCLTFPETDDEHIRQRYADIVSAIEFAAETREINEGTAVRDIALAVVTPVLANISSKMSPGQLKAQSKNIVGKQSTLFDLKYRRSKRSSSRSRSIDIDSGCGGISPENS